jgi:acyl-CoA reductase-like NAD-dependent aldehyde dehydrogenase
MNPHVATPTASAQGQAGTPGSAPRAYLNLIGGRWTAASSGRTTENRNPARTGDLIGTFPASDAGDLDRAVGAAAKAFQSWRLVPAPRRAEVLYRTAEILRASGRRTWPAR